MNIKIVGSKSNIKPIEGCLKKNKNEQKQDSSIINSRPKDFVFFECVDIVRHLLTENFITMKEALTLFSLNTKFRQLLAIMQWPQPPLIVLKNLDLYTTNKLVFDEGYLKQNKFRKDNNFQYKMKVITDRDASSAYKLINRNRECLKNIVAINLGNVTEHNTCALDSMLKLVNSPFPTLKSFTCGDILENQYLPISDEWRNVNCISSGDLQMQASLTFPLQCDDLTEIKVGVIGQEAVLALPRECNKLSKLTLGDMGENAVIIVSQALPNLEYLCLGRVPNSVLLDLPELPNLKSIDFKEQKIENPDLLATLKGLECEIKNRKPTVKVTLPA